jgi:hypothetical protein
MANRGRPAEWEPDWRASPGSPSEEPGRRVTRLTWIGHSTVLLETGMPDHSHSPRRMFTIATATTSPQAGGR